MCPTKYDGSFTAGHNTDCFLQYNWIKRRHTPISMSFIVGLITKEVLLWEFGECLPLAFELEVNMHNLVLIFGIKENATYLGDNVCGDI